MTNPVENGYLADRYGASFKSQYDVARLRQSRGWIMKRDITGTPYRDAAALYPFLCCRQWARLADDMAEIAEEFVSVVAATDPFGVCDAKALTACFDFARPFKDHFVVDTSVALGAGITSSHRAAVKRAQKEVAVEIVERPIEHAGDWIRLYGHLCSRHNIAGLRRFSPDILSAQLDVPGLVMFRASSRNRTVGLNLWYVQGDCVQDHLTAVDADGYRSRASYALKMAALEHFHHRVAWINLGGGMKPDDGLSAFKRGFANGTKPSFICGRITNPSAYGDINRLRGTMSDTTYFPAYRSGEQY